MKTSSCKAKGRRLQQWVADQISSICGVPVEKDGDIESRPMGQSGADVILRGKAKKLFPFSPECSNTENWKVHEKIAQAKANTKEGNWVVFFKRNRGEPVAVIDATVFFELVRKSNENLP